MKVLTRHTAHYFCGVCVCFFFAVFPSLSNCVKSVFLDHFEFFYLYHALSSNLFFPSKSGLRTIIFNGDLVVFTVNSNVDFNKMLIFCSLRGAHFYGIQQIHLWRCRYKLGPNVAQFISLDLGRIFLRFYFIIILRFDLKNCYTLENSP